MLGSDVPKSTKPSVAVEAQRALREAIGAFYSALLAREAGQDTWARQLDREAYRALDELGFFCLEATPFQRRQIRSAVQRARKDDRAYRNVLTRSVSTVVSVRLRPIPLSRDLWGKVLWQLNQARNP